MLEFLQEKLYEDVINTYLEARKKKLPAYYKDATTKVEDYHIFTKLKLSLGSYTLRRIMVINSNNSFLNWAKHFKLS